MLVQVGVFYALLRLRTPRDGGQPEDAPAELRTLSVVVPAYNEAAAVGRWQSLRGRFRC